MLARLVAGVRLPGEHDLDGTPRGGNDGREPLGVLEDEIGTGFLGKPAPEPDGQHRGIEERPERDDAGTARLLARPAAPRALAREFDQITPKPLTDGPELLVGRLPDHVPRRRIVLAIAPVAAKVTIEERGQLARYPARDVHARRD